MYAYFFNILVRQNPSEILLKEAILRKRASLSDLLCGIKRRCLLRRPCARKRARVNRLVLSFFSFKEMLLSTECIVGVGH